MAMERATSERDSDPAQSVEVDRAPGRRVAMTPQDFIAEMLAWCAELFGMTRARFVRPQESDVWTVYTRQRDTVLTHRADYAEIAMAYMVGLGREPLLVTRPRISKMDGSELRPIALRSYLGIPVVCQDRLVGIVEFAGEVRPDVEIALSFAQPRLANFGERLLFDPALIPRPTITVDTTCVLEGAFCCAEEISLSPEELSFLSAIDGATTIAEAAAAADLDPYRAVRLAESLADRGLLGVRTPPPGSLP